MKIAEKPLPLITRTSASPAFIGLPASTFHYTAKTDPTFPKKVRLGPQMTGYLTAELVAWVESKREVAEAETAETAVNVQRERMES